MMRFGPLSWLTSVVAAAAILSLCLASASQAQIPTVGEGPVLDLSDLTDPVDPSIILPSPYVYLGSAVAMDGGYAVVAGLRPGGDGRAYVYSTDGLTWTRESRLDENAGLANLKGFGASVSMGGGSAAVLQRSLSGPTKAVHVFSSDAGWGLEDSITTTDWPVSNVISVAVHGDTLVMGDDKAADSKTGVACGRAAVFVRSPTGWILQAHLAPSDPIGVARFGAAVALDGDRLVVGSPGAKVDAQARHGACYIFERKEGTWKQTTKLIDPGTESYHDFGSTVALSGNTVLVGSPNRTYATTKGTVSAFQRDNVGAWKYEGLLPVPLPDASPAAPAPQFFGSRISLSGSLAAIGSATGRVETERAYLYQRRGDRWQQLSPLDGGRLKSSPGGAVAVSGKSMVVGAALENTAAGLRSGVVRTYQVTTGVAVFDGPSIASPEITDGTDIAVDLGDLVVGRKVSHSFTFQNLGASLLESLTITGDGANGESLVVPTATELPVSASVVTTLNLTPTTSGAWQTRIVFEAYNDTFVRSTITITANVLDAPQPPSVLTPPRTQLVWDEAPVEMMVDAGGTAPLTYQWCLNNQAIKGETQRVLRIRAARAANAGTYTVKVSNSAGTATSAAASLAVYENKADTALRVNDGAPFTLVAPVTGPGVRYRWFFNNVAISDNSTYTGTTTSQLKIAAAATILAGQYSVVLNQGIGQVTPQRWNVSVLLRPTIMNAENFVAALNVARGVSTRINATPAATRYKFTGVPPGITADPYYGTLSGKPTLPGSYFMKVIPSNAAGEGAEKTFPITVTGIDARGVASFRGNIVRHAVNGSLGGAVQFSSSPTGVCTGTLLTGSRIVRFTTSLTQSADATAYFTEVDASLSGVTEQYEIRFNLATGRLTGTLATDSSPEPIAAITGWSNPWSVNNPSAIWSNYCTAGIAPKNAVTDFSLIPGGTSYTTLSIATTGAVAWAGRMADGSVTTLSTFLSPTLLNTDGSNATEMQVFVLLSNGTGSLLGTTKLNQSNVFSPTYHTITGTLDWFKKPAAANSTTRSFKGGITRHDLVMNGAGYSPPSAGLPVIDLLLSPLNAKFTVSGSAIESAAQFTFVDDPFTINGSATALMPSPNILARQLKIDRNLGTFSGSFVLNDPDQLNPAIIRSRTASLYGVLLTRSSSGVGFVALPETPNVFAVPPTTTKTAPIRSAKLVLSPSPVP